MKNFTVDTLNPSQLDDVYELEQLTFSDAWSPSSLLSSFESPHSLFFAATDDESGALLGYSIVYCLSGEAEILNIAVDGYQRERGIGTALMQAMIDGATTRGCELFLLEVRESNTPAIALYEKFGFKTIGRRKNYYVKPTEDALIMQRGNNAYFSF